MAGLREIVVVDPPEWTIEDQEILEWLFPGLRDETPSRPPTPDYPEPPRLRRSRALARMEWDDLLSVV